MDEINESSLCFVTHGSGWAMAQLANSSIPHKFRTLIPDTLFFDLNGSFSSWVFTSKSGEVLRKRTISTKIILERFYLFRKNNHSSFSSWFATARYKNGVNEYLSLASFRAFIENFPSSDVGLLALQSFAKSKGTNGTIFRNTYSVVNDKGKVITSTFTYTTINLLNIVQPRVCASSICSVSTCISSISDRTGLYCRDKDSFQFDQSDPPNQSWNQKDIKLVKSIAVGINESLDNLTKSFVRYIESVQPHATRVLNLSCDYVIDSNDQALLIWTGDVSMVSGKSAQDLRLAKLKEERNSGYSNVKRKNSHQHNKNHILSKPEIENFRKFSNLFQSINNASIAVELYSDAAILNCPYSARNKSFNNKQNGARMTVGECPELMKMKRSLSSSKAQTCSGDFCSVMIMGPKEEANFPIQALSDGSRGMFIGISGVEERDQKSDFVKKLAIRLFSSEELGILRRDEAFLRQIAGVKRQSSAEATGNSKSSEKIPRYYQPTPPAPCSIIWRSVLAARHEGRADTFSTFSENNSNPPPGPMKDTESSIMRMHLRKREEKMLDNGNIGLSAINAYRVVHVCYTCFQVYALLDKARVILSNRGDCTGSFGESKNYIRLPKKKPSSYDFSESAGSHTASILPNSSTVCSSRDSISCSVNENFVNICSINDRSDGRNNMFESNINRNSFVCKAQTKEIPQLAATTSSITSKNCKPRNVSNSQFLPLSNVISNEESSNKVVSNELLSSKTCSKKFEKYKKHEKHPSSLKYQEHVGKNSKMAENYDSALSEDLYHARVLLGESDEIVSNKVRLILNEAGYNVTCVTDGSTLLNSATGQKGYEFDVIMVSRDFPVVDAFSISALLRENYLKAQLSSSTAIKKLPLICLTTQTTPRDLHGYILAGMEGCVGIPICRKNLLGTLKATVPQHLSPQSHQNTNSVSSAATAPVLHGEIEKCDKMKTTPCLNTLQFFELDEFTVVPYCIMGVTDPPKDNIKLDPNRPNLNLVVCHDLFDCYERMELFLRPLLKTCPGSKILLWNYPGQAHSKWNKEKILNNEYLAFILHKLLTNLRNKDFTDICENGKFLLMGFGCGGSVVGFYAAHYATPMPKALIVMNGYAHVDTYMAGVLHDCMNVFKCSPDGRSDLSAYYYARFLFSKDYLSKVSAPLALNMYTSIRNCMTLEGQIALCRGALKHVDLRPCLDNAPPPLICIQGIKNELVRPMHTASFVDGRGGLEARSINEVLHNTKGRRTCVLWVDAGHELFQEAPAHISTLIEQLMTGFHDDFHVTLANTVSMPNAHFTDSNRDFSIKSLNSAVSMNNSTAETDMSRTVLLRQRPHTSYSKARHHEGLNQDMSSVGTGTTVVSTGSQRPKYQRAKNTKRRDDRGVPPWANLQENKEEKVKLGWVTDTEHPSFERQGKVVYGAGGGCHVHPSTKMAPQAREYMEWRLKRNKRFLLRLERAACRIQNFARVQAAKNLLWHLRQTKAAIQIQRVVRGWQGRKVFMLRSKQIKAAVLLQQNIRGFLARQQVKKLRVDNSSAVCIQRIWRGALARKFVRNLVKTRDRAARIIQKLVRNALLQMHKARDLACNSGATQIQRIWRGQLGRRYAEQERDKYIFSRGQSAAVQLGKQLLLEHRLQVTRLQSEVQLLTNEKIEVESSVEATLKEIASFEEHVSALESEMHSLSRAEVAARNGLDEASRCTIQEQKFRLNAEFGIAISQISEQKEKLIREERIVSDLDKVRRVKEEELKALERKLVVLLEEQQRELNSIRSWQDKKLNNSRRDNVAFVRTEDRLCDKAIVPSTKDQLKAAQLMSSTEALMKFGFISMSMTYFSSLNMLRALRTVDKLGVSASPNWGLPPPQVGRKEPLRISTWSVSDVGKWLELQALPQYCDVFADAAIDGSFLYDLSDDDLQNTLGVEHRLHRKKLLGAIARLHQAESEYDRPSSGTISSNSAAEATSKPQNETHSSDSLNSFKFEELAALTRRKKLQILEEILEQIPDKRFNPRETRMQFVDGVGTIYTEAHEHQTFYMNKTDLHGNTLLIIAAQNGALKAAQLFVRKGANPNHQNRQGQSAGHYAVSYKVLEFAEWLFGEVGADDTLQNRFGLGPYDGLQRPANYTGSNAILPAE